jgi:phosphoribosyl-AMP cyclohydrolase
MIHNKCVRPNLSRWVALGKNMSMDQLTQAQIDELWSSLKSNAEGLIPVITTDVTSDKVLMVAWMNHEAFSKTLNTKDVTYFSRSRNELWVKGEQSGNTQKLKEIRIDCDSDSILIKVEQKGNACHTGTQSCFDSKIIWTTIEQ